MAVIVRDAVAADQLVYAWPFPIGPEPIEVTCGAEEIVVMCPAWMVGDRLGPGRHQWRSPDPARPTNAYFVLTAPVEIPFDMMTSFVVPSTQLPVRLRAQGSLLARCMDPALLVAQFVGLPFADVNGGVIRSVGASVEKLLARVLVRRVIAAGSPFAATDPGQLPSIIDELTAYNPTAGAVVGVGFVRFNQLVVQGDDGGMGGAMWNAHASQSWGGSSTDAMHQSYSTGAYAPAPGSDPAYVTGGFAIGSNPPPAATQPLPEPTPPPPAPVPVPASDPGIIRSSDGAVASGEIGAGRKKSVPPSSVTPDPPPQPKTFPAGTRVLVSAPNGTLHAATVRAYADDYYEVEIGATKDVIWVPITHCIPDK